MPLFRRSSSHGRYGLSDRELAVVIAMATAELGPKIVSNPADLLDDERAASVDLPDLVRAITGQPRGQWPAAVHAYYAANGQTIEQGIALEARAASLADAARYLGAMLEAGLPEDRLGVTAAGSVPGTRYVLVLQDQDAVRTVLPSVLGRWGISVDEAFAAARVHVAAMPVRLEPMRNHPGTYTLDVSPNVSIGLAVEMLDRVAPEAVGPLGTVVSILTRNVAAVRPLVFEPGLREGFAALAQTHDTWRAANPSVVHEALLWRRFTGEVVAIDMRLSAGPRGPQLHLDDPRFRGVLTAVEPKQLLPVPEWASGVFDSAGYTRFAGVVCAGMTAPALPPETVATLANDLPLVAAAHICATVEADDWPRVIGSMTRIGIRWGPPKSHRVSLDGHWPRDMVEATAGNLVAGLRSVIADMPAITWAGLTGCNALRVTGPYEAGKPLAEQSGAEFERDLEVLVVRTGEGNRQRDLDRLMAACAVFMPPGLFTSVRTIEADDAALEDQAHVVPLR